MSFSPQISKYRLSRRGRKLQVSDDYRTLVALPKDVPERTWAEILQKEENDLVVFEIREEILEEALTIGYEHYMDKQNAPFTAYCAAQAWLKLIDWHFYRHDPGEDPSAHPPCFIPKRIESWVPDELPDPSPKDSWCRHDLNVVEDTPEEGLQRWPSNSSLDYPVVEEIPSEYWFPGKLRKTVDDEDDEKTFKITTRQPPVPVHDVTVSAVRRSARDSSSSRSEDLAAESELLEHVTDYTDEELKKKESTYSALKTTTPVEGSLQGAGDATAAMKFKRRADRSKTLSRVNMMGRSRGQFLPPLDRDSRSKVSIISDCRLRNLRLDTQYEISSEKVDTPPGEPAKRK